MMDPEYIDILYHQETIGLELYYKMKNVKQSDKQLHTWNLSSKYRWFHCQSISFGQILISYLRGRKFPDKDMAIVSQKGRHTIPQFQLSVSYYGTTTELLANRN
jgi:hypothetical protein